MIKVLEGDFSHSTFSTFSFWYLAEILSHVLRIVIENEVGDICVAARSWGQGKRRAKGGKHQQGEVGRAEETECKQTMPTLHFSWSRLCARYQETSLFLHFLIHTFNLITNLNGPVPERF